jgi:phage gpG-like protein
MKIRLLLLVSLCLGLAGSLLAGESVAASDGTYVAQADAGWQSRQGKNMPVKPLFDLSRDNAAALTLARETDDSLRGATLEEVMRAKIEQFGARLTLSRQTAVTTRKLAGLEAVQVEFDSSANDGNGVMIQSRLVLTIARESETSVLTSIASCRTAAQDKYLPQLRAILDSLAKRAK